VQVIFGKTYFDEVIIVVTMVVMLYGRQRQS